jgi:hypothetical protein
VCVVNQTFQRKYLGAGGSGLKVPMALFGQNQEGEATIVGVAEDVRYIGSATTSLAELYFSHRQLTVGVRRRSPPCCSAQTPIRTRSPVRCGAL